MPTATLTSLEHVHEDGPADMVRGHDSVTIVGRTFHHRMEWTCERCGEAVIVLSRTREETPDPSEGDESGV